tara:strand:- start:14791 stop:15741 length:951 start_codon:yes stop_codon:yes gene_type:complete
MQTQEQGILERIKVSRGTSEPVTAPTENLEVVNVSEDTPIEEVVETEALANEEVAPEIEEAAEAEIAQATDEDEGEDLYVEYKGREINLKDVYEAEQGQLRQADYTRKTTGHARDVDAFKVKEADFAVKESELNDKLLTLEAMLNEDTKTVEEIAEMREYEPEEYIKYTEKQSKLKEFVNSAKTATQQPSVDMAKVSADLFANHPEWMDNGKQSQKFIDDTNLMTKYAETRGIGQVELSSFEAKHYEVMLDAARYKAQSASNAAIEKKVRKAPVSTKPRAAARGIDTAVDKAQKAFNKNPNVQNAAALRTAKRQIN